MAKAQPNWNFPNGTRFDDAQNPGQIIEVQDGQPVVVGSDQYAKSKSAADDATMKAIGDQLASVDALHQHAQQFMALNNSQSPVFGTSPLMAPSEDAPTHNPIVSALQTASRVANPVNWDPNLRGMNALTQQMALANRTPGLRMTQMEFGALRGAVPNVSSTLDANKVLADNIANANTYVQAKHAFYTSWRQQHGNLDGVDAPWSAFKASRFDSAGRYVPPAKPGAKAPPVDPRAAANQALIARSAAAAPPVAAAVDLDGNPVTQ